MPKPNFENHREEKLSTLTRISIITENGNIHSGWSNGRSMIEISEEFGKYAIDWFYIRTDAKAYVIQNKGKFQGNKK